MITTKIITDLHDIEYEVVEFEGELDTAALINLEKKMNEYIDGFIRPFLIFDFSKLKYINSDGIGFIATLNAKLVKKNAKLMITNLQPHVADVFDAIGILNVLPMYASRSQAIAAIKKQS